MIVPMPKNIPSIILIISGPPIYIIANAETSNSPNRVSISASPFLSLRIKMSTSPLSFSASFFSDQTVMGQKFGPDNIVQYHLVDLLDGGFRVFDDIPLSRFLGQFPHFF